MSEIKDAWGTPLYVGDTVVYPVRHGSNLHMVKARIESFSERENWGKSVPVLNVTRLSATGWRGEQGVEAKTVPVVAIDRVTRL